MGITFRNNGQGGRIRFRSLGLGGRFASSFGAPAVPFVGLLDTYPNAAAAYSLRKLRTAYSGAAIRVRRSSDNAEQDIGFDGSGNLNEAALTSFVGVNNGFVTTWYDQSGNGRNAIQNISTSQPSIVSSGVINKVNSKPCIVFFANLSSTYLISYKFAQPSTNWVIFSTNLYFNPSSYYVYGTDGNGYQASGIYIEYNYLVVNRSGGFAGIQAPSNVPQNTLYLLAFEYYSNNTAKAHINNQSTSTQSMLISGNPFTTGAISNYWIGAYRDGAGNYFNAVSLAGAVSEHIVYETNQSSNVDNIKSNINSYYAIY